MTRALVLGVFFVSLLLLEAVALPLVAIRGVAPDLTVLAVVGLGLCDGPSTGAKYGFLAGAIRDLLAPAAGLMGPWMLALLLVGYVAGTFRPFVTWSELPSHVAVGLLGAVGASVVSGLLNLVLTTGSHSLGDVVLRGLVAAGWALVLAPVVVRFSQRISLSTAPAVPPL